MGLNSDSEQTESRTCYERRALQRLFGSTQSGGDGLNFVFRKNILLVKRIFYIDNIKVLAEDIVRCTPCPAVESFFRSRLC